jgi:hypothetical protein
MTTDIMEPATVFHGIASCVAPFMVPNNPERPDSYREKDHGIILKIQNKFLKNKRKQHVNICLIGKSSAV